MTHYDRLKRKRLGDILVDEGVASRDAIIDALHEQQSTHALLSDILLAREEVTEYELARVLVEQYQVPYIDMSGYTVHKDLIQSFPATLLHRATVVPLDRFGQQICFACQEIPPGELAAELRKHADGAGMYFFAAIGREVREVLQEHAPLTDAEQALVVRPTPAAPPADTEEIAAEVAVTPAPEEDPEAEGGAWRDLFDAANEAILSDLKPEDQG